MLTKVLKWGNSQGLRLTKALLNEAGIHVGDEVNVSVQRGRIVVEALSRVRSRYDLNALLSEMPKKYQPEELDWGPAGWKGSLVDALGAFGGQLAAFGGQLCGVGTGGFETRPYTRLLTAEHPTAYQARLPTPGRRTPHPRRR